MDDGAVDVEVEEAVLFSSVEDELMDIGAEEESSLVASLSCDCNGVSQQPRCFAGTFSVSKGRESVDESLENHSSVEGYCMRSKFGVETYGGLGLQGKLLH